MRLFGRIKINSTGLLASAKKEAYTVFKSQEAVRKITRQAYESGAVPDNGEQAQLVLGSLKLLLWPPTYGKGVIVSHLPGAFFASN